MVARVSLDQQVRQVLARLALLQLAPPVQQALELPDLRGEMARVVLQVPRDTRVYKALLGRWARQAIPVLKAMRAARVLPGSQVILEASERRVLQAHLDPKGLKA